MDPELRAMWAENRGFDEVLISKRMIKDHMPDTVLESLAKVTKTIEALPHYGAGLKGGPQVA